MRHGGFGRTDFPTACTAASRRRRDPGDSQEATVLAAPEAACAGAGEPLTWLTRKPPRPEDCFRGFGPTADADGIKTLDALSALAVMMADVGRSNTAPEWSNPHIPAGYTYLGQFISHDMVNSRPLSGPLPTVPVRNYRLQPLRLDAVYGSGTDAAPWLYEPGAQVNAPRVRLGLGETNKGPQSDAPPVGLDDVRRVDGMAGRGANRRRTLDPVIADQRNDDNLILSQLVTTFHKFHNNMLDRLETLDPLPAPGSHDHWIGLRRHFAIARELTTYVYRRIVALDYLNRILPSSVWETYRGRLEGAIGPDPIKTAATAGVPIEFSLAAFRFGHVTVDSHYAYNHFHPGAPLSELMDFTGLDDATRLPLTSDWVIDWRRFFYDVPSGEIVLSRRIRPAVVRVMEVHPSLTATDRPGGLVYRTLARGFASGLWNGQSLAAELGLTPLVTKDLRDLLTAYNKMAQTPVKLATAVIDMLAADTPLFLYVIAEAEIQQQGLRLGSLGGEIVAQVFCAQLERSHQPLSADARRYLQLIFGAAAPASMQTFVSLAGHGI